MRATSSCNLIFFDYLNIISFYQAKKLSNLIGLSLSFNVLKVDQFGCLRMTKNMMTANSAHEFETKSFEQFYKILKRNIVEMSPG